MDKRGGCQLRWMGPVAWGAVMRRTAPLLSLSLAGLWLSLAEGTRVGREEICRRVCR
jgi:hypothetical protein